MKKKILTHVFALAAVILVVLPMIQLAAPRPAEAIYGDQGYGCGTWDPDTACAPYGYYYAQIYDPYFAVSCPVCNTPTTCADLGQVGNYPDCTAPAPTCQTYGYAYGTLGCCYNNPDRSDDACYTPPVVVEPTCQTYGYAYGTLGCCYNNPDRSDDACIPPPPVVDVCPNTYGNQSSYSECNCIDNPSGPGCYVAPTDVCPATPGNQSSYSECNCVDNPSGYGCYVPTPPSCADSGMLGTPPYCYPPPPTPTCVAYTGQYCTTSNSCGMSNGGAYQCDGSCSAGAPPESSCPVVPPAPTPSVSCNVSNTNPTVGATVQYTAAPTGGATGPYSWNSSSSGSFGSAVTASRTFATPGTYDMQVKGSNTGYATCPFVTVGAAPCNDGGSASIDASRTRVPSGSSVTLTWSASDASAACTISGPGVAQSSTPAACSVSGSATTPAITTQATYTISCPNGVTDSVIVNVLPKIEEF